jgi:hypothetical protein
MAENEATFEARLDAAISKTTPLIARARITHQDSFGLHFGHHAITIDGKARFDAEGRGDVLLAIDAIPRVMFELKRPGEPLTDDDRDQGISYARLLEPMPPFPDVPPERVTVVVEARRSVGLVAGQEIQHTRDRDPHP